ncbi:MAG: zinc ribbon domain-containing protein [Thermofilum sp.]|nr:zinc ribbon domain-containing protein [Thermofilum sp.]
MVGVGSGGLRGGFRVFRVHVDRANMERLRQLFRDFADGCARTKGALRYREEWMAEWGNVLKMREEAGKRTMPNPPAITLLTKFITPDGGVRGNKNAPCVIDLRRRELRVPSYGVAVPLRGSMVEALIGENELEPRPDFVLQVTRRGFLRVIARREVQAALALPLRIITLDENSSYGFALAALDVSADGTKVSLRLFEKLRPPNHGYRREVAKLLQSYAKRPSEEARQRLSEILPQEVLEKLTTERARELAGATRAKEKRLNEAFIQRLAAEVRRLMREARQQGMGALVLIDPIDPDSLRGTRLQGTLLRARRRLKNLAMYEGAMLRLLRASGRHCPRCGYEGREVGHTKRSRIYECPRCRLRWDRDKGALYNLAYSYFAGMVREECDDYTAMACRVLASLREWLERHKNSLTR